MIFKQSLPETDDTSNLKKDNQVILSIITLQARLLTYRSFVKLRLVWINQVVKTCMTGPLMKPIRLKRYKKLVFTRKWQS